jgi:hypothetical protein
MVNNTPILSLTFRIPTRLAWFWIIVFLFLLHVGPVLAAKIEVSLDRNRVPLDESFTLIFSTTETPDDNPDWSPLEKDFEILDRRQNSEASVINFTKIVTHTEWQVTVMAKKAGTLDIPPIAFGNDRSEPFQVTVLPAGAARRGDAGAGDAEILLEVEAEPKKPYVQAQVIYTVRVLSRVPFSDARFSSRPEAADALVEQLNNGQEISGGMTRNGVHYRATEVRYAIFPQKSGPLRIGPMHLEAQAASGGRSLFDPFFNRMPRVLRVSSDAVELDVRPVPAEFAGKHWLPAESLALEDSWSNKPPQAHGGEPITRTLTVKAQGSTVGLLPELNANAVLPADIKQYPDQPFLNEEKRHDGLSSIRQEKTALIVSPPGAYRMPAVEIPWWNTRTDRMEIARLPERTLTVLPSAQAPASEASPAPAMPEASPPPAPAPVAPPATGSQTPAQAPTGNPWFWLAVLFGAGWLATAAAWRFSRKPGRARTPASGPDAAPSERQVIAAVERACRTNDPLAARRALVAWAAHRWPDAPVGAEDLGRRCGGELGREIGLLNRSLYGRSGTEWQGQGLWRSFRAYVEADKPAANRSRTAAELEPLYKL